MGSINCMNEVCRGMMLPEWKKGWSLKSGGFATLCFNCGSAYENSAFCLTFHSRESGWRECRLCGKFIHCGCAASRHLHDYMDLGGVRCKSCINRLGMQSVQSIKIPGNISKDTVVTNGIHHVHPAVENRIDDAKFTNESLLQLTSLIGTTDVGSALKQLKREESILKSAENNSCPPNLTQQETFCNFLKPDSFRQMNGIKEMYKSQSQPSVNFVISKCSDGSSPVIHEASEQNNGYLQQDQRVHPRSESFKERGVVRSPGEGRARSQILPRYWPKIADQKLQLISGDSKSSIIPLFEKVLSASDAGRIGRLVIPKACAETYFPPIDQSEGIPVGVQDTKGKKWTFQFRFWPNNNSRMYVLEGVNPCIISMQLQAGDTVTFSRIDPGGQLLIGCRKATYIANVQDSQTPFIPNGNSPGEPSFSGVSNDLPDLKKKKTRNMRKKRHHMYNDDAVEVRVTWEEAQKLLLPSPDSKPTTVTMEGYDFEEFDEPPVLRKATNFARPLVGSQEQLAQCDSCSKWRRVPLRVVVPEKWVCSENMWDLNRASCSAPEDVNLKDLEFTNKGFKKRKVSNNGGRTSALDALASIANIYEAEGSSIVNSTTKHPRHRPGCVCIVCIQPPSGQNKHKSTCQCYPCSTVRRRQNTQISNKRKKKCELDVQQGGNDLLVNNHENGVEENNNVEALLDLNLNCDPRRDDGVSLTSLMNASIVKPSSDMFLGRENGPSLKPCLVSQTSTGDKSMENLADEEHENDGKDGKILGL